MRFLLYDREREDIIYPWDARRRLAKFGSRIAFQTSAIYRSLFLWANTRERWRHRFHRV